MNMTYWLAENSMLPTYPHELGTSPDYVGLYIGHVDMHLGSLKLAQGYNRVVSQVPLLRDLAV